MALKQKQKILKPALCCNVFLHLFFFYYFTSFTIKFKENRHVCLSATFCSKVFHWGHIRMVRIDSVLSPLAWLVWILFVLFYAVFVPCSVSSDCVLLCSSGI
ncbi:hypothetical protein CHARACLAT_031144 [Characodon lateralis]|uniref:ATP synthase F0 subunit 8 n=1 Tax=Characodon lateralis TaxID=208331 RepID=A0ABU7CWS3_9TELE|nr:hypothetical protein [Characodon lateralis]